MTERCAITCMAVKSACLHVFEEYPSAEPDAVLEGPQEVLVGELDDVDAVQGESGILAHVLDVAVRLALVQHHTRTIYIYMVVNKQQIQ